MKATDFNFAKDLKFDLESGIAAFRNTRIVMFDADAVGLLRQSILEQVGTDAARRMLFRFGYQHGFSDFIQMKMNYQFDSEMDQLASGPVIHTWEGIVKAEPREIAFDRETGAFHFTGVWTNSYEAQQYLTFNHPSDAPVCWSLTGYASGWCTAFFGHPLLALEPKCVGMGHDTCEWLIRPEDAFGPEAQPFIDAIADFRAKKGN